MCSGENLESEPGKRVCPACRYLCPGDAVVCENCGILLPEDIESNGHHRRGKESNESLVKALIAGPFIWLYTIRRNWWKFGISVITTIAFDIQRQDCNSL